MDFIKVAKSIFTRQNSEPIADLKPGDRVLMRKVLGLECHWYWDKPLVRYQYIEGTVKEISLRKLAIALESGSVVSWYPLNELELLEILGAKTEGK